MSVRPAHINLSLLWHFVRQDFADRYSGAALGRSWLLIAPLVQIFIFTVVFGGLLGSRLPGTQSGTFGYGIYLVAGILPWTAFAATVSRTTTVFLDKRGILTKVPVSLAMMAVHIAIVEGLTLVGTLGLFTVIAVLLSAPPSPGILYLPLLILFQQTLAFALGLVCAILTVFIRDVRELVGVGLMVWFWMTPIVYVIDIVLGLLQAAQSVNPAWLFVAEYHKIYAYGAVPDAGLLLAKLAGALIAAAVMVWLLSRAERAIRDVI